MIIGITGGTGCGKTTALDAIRDMGGLVLDCDAIYHRLLQEDPALLRAIDNRFPGTVDQGVLQRKKLGALKLNRVRPEDSLLQPDLGFQAAMTPRGMAIKIAHTTPVPVRIREGTTRWPIIRRTG